MNPYIIIIERVGLRQWQETDLEPFAEMNRDAEVMKYFPQTLTGEETLELFKRINLHFEKNNFGLFAVEDKITRQFIGFTGFAIPGFTSFFTPCVEIGWRFKRAVWGKGLATESAGACLQYGFATLHFDRVVSFTSAIHVNSEKVMKKIGMARTGEFNHLKIDINNPLCRHVVYEAFEP